MLRAIMALLFAFLFLVVGIPVLGIEWLYGKINKKGAELSSLRIVQWAFSTIIGICDTDVICHKVRGRRRKKEEEEREEGKKEKPYCFYHCHWVLFVFWFLPP